MTRIMPKRLKRQIAVERIHAEIKRRRLRLAGDKTELLILYGGRRLTNLTLEIGGTRIHSKEEVVYLGAWA